MLLDAAAGAIAGCIARFLTGPLDVIKIRFQVQLEPIASSGVKPAEAAKSKYTGFTQAFGTILKEEGVQGLWRGTVPGLLLTVPYTAVQFVALQQVRQLAVTHGLTANPSFSPVISFTSGAIAGAAATVASYPFDLLRTTMAAQGEPKVYRSMWDAARGIVSNRGVQGLYSGLGVTLVEIIPYAALQFGLYDALNGLVNEARERSHIQLMDASSSGRTGDDRHATHASRSSASSAHETRVQHFACGLLAGLLAKLASHPLDVAKKRYQVAGLQRSLRYGARVEAGLALRSLGETLLVIYRTEGVAGLWKGSIPSIIKAAPSAAITFTAYDMVLTWLLVAAKQQ